jgi:peptide-methionine (R)-S-oxide reductase
MQTPAMWIITVVIAAVFAFRMAGRQAEPVPAPSPEQTRTNTMDKQGYTDAATATDGKIVKTDTQWRQILTPEQYSILRQKGTEQPYTGIYNDHYEKGTYQCAACGQVLFKSDTKYPSHCGWPAFYDVEQKGRVIRRTDRGHGMVRVEVQCSRCGGHLGHVFEDGPPPTGLRYCINSASLQFVPDKE